MAVGSDQHGSGTGDGSKHGKIRPCVGGYKDKLWTSLLVKGLYCRYLDKLVDELAKGRPMDKILRA